MQTLDVHRPGMPDLQFALLVTALCTSRLIALNIPDTVRTRIFDRCWVLIHDNPPPGTRIAMLAARERGQALRHVVSPG